MTAEIAIINKSAIALAADSAITIGTASGPKIYDTVDKLFRLSRHYPVGVMIHGAVSFVGVPWETIIKEYRDYVGTAEATNPGAVTCAPLHPVAVWLRRFVEHLRSEADELLDLIPRKWWARDTLLPPPPISYPPMAC